MKQPGYKTGSINYEFETKTFNYDRGIRLMADVMDVEEAGVLDCFWMTSTNQMLTSCGSLETIYANNFSSTGLSGSLMFYSCTNLASVSGLGNLSGVRSMRYTFSSCAFMTIDFRGFDPSTLMDLFYTFSGRSRLTTILADANWALPSSGLTGLSASTRAPRRSLAATAPHGPATRRRTRTSASTRQARRGASRQRRTACPSGRASRAERPWSRAARSRRFRRTAAEPR